ncbi:External alternative NAD(P)H-ubiquinone oxidoreductase B1, mitochondrial, partial [Cytospora mali]
MWIKDLGTSRESANFLTARESHPDGWAGYTFARTLDPAKYERVVVSPRSYFVFTPLLASTAVGTLEFRATLESVRRLGDVKFHQGWADDVDFNNKIIRVEENHVDELSTKTVLPPPQATKGTASSDVQVTPVPAKGPVTEVRYDKLVIAVGAYSQTFGIEGVRQHAHFLRDVGDARRIRLKVLSIFEQCASPSISDEDRKKLLHFAIVGGGPTGIEFAAELHDLIHEDLKKMYADLLRYVQITVYDVAPKILPMFDQALASYAMRHFGRQKIAVKTAHSIQRVRPDDNGLGGVLLKVKEYGGEEVGAGLVVWSTGLMQNPLVEKLCRKGISGTVSADKEFRLEKDRRSGGVIVDGQLRARVIGAADADALAASPPPAP